MQERRSVTLPMLLVFAGLGVAASAPAYAESGFGVQAQNTWSRMDKCTRTAFEKYPDQTADGLAKREAYTRQCQRANGTPVRASLAPKN